MLNGRPALSRLSKVALGLMAPVLLFGLVVWHGLTPISASAERPHLVNQDVCGLKDLEPPFTFVVIGDNRSGTDIYAKLVDRIAKDNPAFVISDGDIALDGKDKKSWEEFVGLSRPLTMPYLIAPGNHEIWDKESENEFKLNMRQPGNELYYSFKAGDALFIALDSEVPGDEAKITGEQWDWLVDTLEGSKEKFKFVYLHRPLYPDKKLGRHYGDSLNKYTDERDKLMTLFKKHGVDAIFAGHDHMYVRSERDGIIHVITGGGGSPLYTPREKGGFYHYIRASIDDDTASFKVIDVDGVVRDEFQILKDEK